MTEGTALLCQLGQYQQCSQGLQSQDTSTANKVLGWNIGRGLTILGDLSKKEYLHRLADFGDSE